MNLYIFLFHFTLLYLYNDTKHGLCCDFFYHQPKQIMGGMLGGSVGDWTF